MDIYKKGRSQGFNIISIFFDIYEYAICIETDFCYKGSVCGRSFLRDRRGNAHLFL